MSTEDRVSTLDARLLAQLPDAGARAATAAGVADCEATVAAALALFLQGDDRGVLTVLGAPQTDHGVTVMLSVLAALGAAAEALNAAFGNDADRAQLALIALQERSAEYSEAGVIFTRRAEQSTNTG